jgi:hypothetical protein
LVAELWVELFCGAEMRTKTAIELLVGATLLRAGFCRRGGAQRSECCTGEMELNHAFDPATAAAFPLRK